MDSKLPENLRALVLSYTVPTPRTRLIELYGSAPPTSNPRIRYISWLPPLLAISQETRIFSITYEGGAPAHLFAVPKLENVFRIKFKCDVVFLSSRFTPSGKYAETSRLWEVSSLLKPAFLAQVHKVVVAYSSLEDFSVFDR